MFKVCFYILLFLHVSQAVQAQVKKTNKPATAATPSVSNKVINVISAASLSFDQEKNNAKVLTGNVVCEHEGALLHCDTALIFDGEKKMQATGHILITKGDSIRVTGDKLFYDGKTKLATLENNVKCVEKEMTLTTDFLTFEVGNSIANYYNGGTIVNKDNTLTSKRGHYYSSGKEARFHEDVVLTNPDYKMNSDTLLYRIGNKTTYFLGPSIILSKTDYIYCENGWYDTDKEKAQFSKNALLVTAQQKLRGDSLTYDRNARIGRAFRNVVLTDTTQKSILYGDYVEYKQLKSEALVTKKAIYARLVEDDTLFIAADTLYHLDLDSVNNFLNAYHNVKIYKKDLQGVCDSASLNTIDSLLQLFKSPVLWSNYSQATAKIIRVDVGKNRVNGFHLDGKAFLIQQADTVTKDKFNQLSGRVIDGIISNDTIRKVTVKGNADVIYYPKNKDKPIAQNKTTSSEISLWFRNQDVERASFKPATDGVIDPIKTVDLENARLKGFNWLYDQRPRSRAELHLKKQKNEVAPKKTKEGKG
jgi:lipopolysaccharide export system protein LptA